MIIYVFNCRLLWVSWPSMQTLVGISLVNVCSWFFSLTDRNHLRKGGRGVLNPARSRAVCRWRRKMFVSCQQGEVNSDSQFHFSIPPFVQSGTPARMFVPPTCRIAFPSVHLFWELPQRCTQKHVSQLIPSLVTPAVKTGSHKYLAELRAIDCYCFSLWIMKIISRRGFFCSWTKM